MLLHTINKAVRPYKGIVAINLLFIFVHDHLNSLVDRVDMREDENRIMIDFLTWFNIGCYGGLAFCILAITANSLYTVSLRRGTKRQLTRAIIICAIAALLLIPAIIWFNLRLNGQMSISRREFGGILAYIAICGWLLPLGITIAHFLFARPRAAVPVTGRQKKGSRNASGLYPPRYQSGVLPPYVFSEDTPWGWLEYGNGNFQGQRLALKRAIATIGRDENCDIWLDDDMASRYHAEVAWYEGRACLTDAGSLNGVMLDGRTVQGTRLLESNAVIEIGAQRFVFLLADQKDIASDQYDPLTNHTWRSSQDLQPENSASMPAAKLTTESVQVPSFSQRSKDTPPLLWNSAAPPVFSQARLSAVLFVCDGEMAGQRFVLTSPVMTVGHGFECDIAINDVSVARQHVQFLHQANGDYVQDLESQSGTLVNGERVSDQRLLVAGDTILIGNIRLFYSSGRAASRAPVPHSMTPLPPSNSLGGPTPLKLPSRPKQS